jgi:hypothetical protein
MLALCFRVVALARAEARDVPYWAEPGEQQRRAIERACSVCRSSLPGGCCPLVRPSMKPRQLQLARRSSAANAASGWDGLGFATPFQAVTKPRPADPRIRGNRTNRRVLDNGDNDSAHDRPPLNALNDASDESGRRQQAVQPTSRSVVGARA